MTDNEIIEYLKQNEENTHQIIETAKFLVIKHILIANKLITKDSFDELVEQTEQKLRENQVKCLTREERNKIETLIKFANMFGGGKDNE